MNALPGGNGGTGSGGSGGGGGGPVCPINCQSGVKPPPICQRDACPLLPPFSPAVTWPYASDWPESLSEPPDFNKWYPAPVPGVINYPLACGSAFHVIDAYGWLLNDSHSCNDDPDWEYDFEIDPERTTLDLSALYRVGNIIEFGRAASTAGGPTYKRLLTTPAIHVEIRGFYPGGCAGINPAVYKWSITQCAGGGAYFAFNPEVDQQMAAGDRVYVHIVGALVIDEPHLTDGPGADSPMPAATAGDMIDVKRIWSDCHTFIGNYCSGDNNSHGFAPVNPARWTEIHPPDLIEVQPPQKQTEVVRSLLLTGDHGLLSGDTIRIDDVIFPCPDDPTHPCAPPAPGMTTGVYEHVDPATTNFKSITDGENSPQGFLGPKLTLFTDHVEVMAQVHGSSGDGAYGKLNTLFRVLWCHCGCDGTCPLPGPAGGVAQCLPPVCGAGQACQAGACVPTHVCSPSCAGKCNGEPDGCGGHCGCSAAQQCVSGTCRCKSECVCGGHDYGCLDSAACKLRCAPCAHPCICGQCGSSEVECEHICRSYCGSHPCVTP